MGVIDVAGKPLAVAIATRPADGAHVTAAHNLTAIAQWIETHANPRSLPIRVRC
jgi:hypothetical protein